MVSHHHKCIFVHIPKTAGTSINNLLGQKGNNPIIGSGNIFKIGRSNRFDPPPSHLRADDYLKYDFVTPEQFESYFKFAFVRNPWDRLVSEYKYRRLSHKYDFKTYLLHKFPRPEWSDEYCHVLPQYDFIFDEEGNQRVDFIGRYENLKEDIKVVLEKLGLKSRSLPHKNRSLSLNRNFGQSPVEVLKNVRDVFSIKVRRNTYTHYSQYYDDEAREVVAEVYKNDILTFGYQFQRVTSGVSLEEAPQSPFEQRVSA